MSIDRDSANRWFSARAIFLRTPILVTTIALSLQMMPANAQSLARQTFYYDGGNSPTTLGGSLPSVPMLAEEIGVPFFDNYFSTSSDYNYINAMTKDGSGNLWYGTWQLNRMSPSGTFASFKIPFSKNVKLRAGQELPGDYRPTAGHISGIVTAPDGAVWFTLDSVGITTPSSTIPSSDNYLSGNVRRGTVNWLSNNYSIVGAEECLGRISSDGTTTMFSVSKEFYPTVSYQNSCQLGDIAVDRDGNLWVIDHEAVTVDRVTPAGQFTKYRLPSRDYSPDAPYTTSRFRAPNIATSHFYTAESSDRGRHITVAKNGTVWFLEDGFSTSKVLAKIGKIDSAGTVSEYDLPVVYPPIVQSSSRSPTFSIVADNIGNAWVTNGDALYRVSQSGVVTSFPVTAPSTGSFPWARIGLSAGPDGKIWFHGITAVAANGNELGYIDSDGKMTAVKYQGGGYHTGGPYIDSDGVMWTWFRFAPGTIDAVTLPAQLRPLSVGPIFSTEQPTSRSFLRFYNSGTTAGTVTATVRDSATGQSLGQYTSPNIAAGTSLQVPVNTLESGLTLGATRPTYFSITVQSNIRGSFQHVLFRPSEGTLTNLSTCATGVTADPTKLFAVHSSIVGDLGYPSTIAVSNAGSVATTVDLGVYDALNGTKIGTYPVSTIPANGQAILTVATIEAGLNFKPTGALGQYIIKAEGSFTGFLQHLVTNQQQGVVTDMTTACALQATGLP